MESSEIVELHLFKLVSSLSEVLLVTGSISEIAPKVKNSERNCASVFSRQVSCRSTNKGVLWIVTWDYSILVVNLDKIH